MLLGGLVLGLEENSWKVQQEKRREKNILSLSWSYKKEKRSGGWLIRPRDVGACRKKGNDNAVLSLPSPSVATAAVELERGGKSWQFTDYYYFNYNTSTYFLDLASSGCMWLLSWMVRSDLIWSLLWPSSLSLPSCSCKCIVPVDHPL